MKSFHFGTFLITFVVAFIIAYFIIMADRKKQIKKAIADGKIKDGDKEYSVAAK